MDEVKVSIPLKSEYVLIARLAASGCCARLGLDMDKTEDVKVTISEILNKHIGRDTNETDKADISFSFAEGYFLMTFEIKGMRKVMEKMEEDDLGYAIIKALSDSAELISRDELVIRFKIDKDI